MTFRWTHRLAWLMAALALLPIGIGAVVTTVEAGMAFADWPNSDGYLMITYPWLKSSGDKFLEHGHRLAGMLIGIVSLAFAGWSFAVDRRPAVRRLAVLILIGVIAQGLLGGLRVRMNNDELALLHGSFAAWVFTAMCLAVAAAATPQATIADAGRPGAGLIIASATSFAAVVVQYVLGGRLRHLGASDAWLIHPWFAIAVVVSVIVVQILAQRRDLPRIQTYSQIAVWLVGTQAALGIFTWGAKYGYPQWDIVAEPLSPAQVALSSLHQVVGLLTFAAIGVTFVQVLAAFRNAPETVFEIPSLPGNGGEGTSIAGGIA
jgi:cytochrome c oxidase assembly protein subunit 15